jgi:rhamnose utilization protein RhaD (predicted bifunctional aldolase and dehydrogenase)
MQSKWNDTEARKHQGLAELVYRSRLIGGEPNLVLWGGGNTSAKLVEKDFRGREVNVLRIKGSGADLRTIRPEQFPGVRLDEVLPVRDREAMTDEELVVFLAHCLMEPLSPRPSIETLLHAFVPFRHIDHSHADAILSLTNNLEGSKHTRAVYGDEVVWIPYRRPGFALSKQVAEEVDRTPKTRGCVLEKHGLITWAETSRESYETHIELNTRAEEYLSGVHQLDERSGAVRSGAGHTRPSAEYQGLALGTATAPTVQAARGRGARRDLPARGS